MKLDSPLTLLQPEPSEHTFEFHPTTFDEYIGQESLKKKLKIYSKAALMREEPLDHILLFGPPGLGKTTMAHIIAQVMGSSLKMCSGPMLERAGDLVAILSNLDPRSILFIDEIHRIPIAIEEILYSAMEHFKIDIIIGQGAGAQTVTLPIQPFTLIGATTKPALLSAPLRSRFGISERLDFYTDHELQSIVEHHGRFLQLTITAEAALHIACCSRGTPRIAKKIMRRVRDVAQVQNKTSIEITVVSEALNLLGIDESGLTQLDHHILRTIVEVFRGGPVGVETIASMVGEDSTTLEEVYEPYLLRKGYIERTPRGRQIPQKVLAHIKKRYGTQKSIF